MNDNLGDSDSMMMSVKTSVANDYISQLPQDEQNYE